MKVTPSVRVRVLEGFDDPQFGPAQWDALLHTGDTDVVHLTWHWQRAWWEALGRGDLLLIAAERNDRIIALAPLHADSGMIFFVGSGDSQYMDFVGDIGDAEVLDGILETARELVPHLEGFRFYAVLESSRTGKRLRAAADRLGMACYDENRWPARVVDLAMQPEVVVRRVVPHRGALKFRQFREGRAILPQLDELFEQHVSQWAMSSHPSPFLEHEQRAFLERLTHIAACTGWLRFARLEWRRRPVAFEYGWCYRGTYSAGPSSFAVDLAHRSPDQLLRRRLLLSAINEGVSTYDLGTDDEGSYRSLYPTHVKYAHAWGLYPPPPRRQTTASVEEKFRSAPAHVEPMRRADLIEHPAVEALSRLRSTRVEPTGIERLKKEWKAQVFRLEGVGPDGSAVIAKRCERVNGLIERTIYEEVLPRLPGPTLRCYGYLEEPTDQFCWLFLEDAGEEDEALPLEEYRVLAARWLATMHHATVNAGLDARLPDRGPGHYLEHLRLARRTILANLADSGLDAEDVAILEAIVTQCDTLERHWTEVEELYTGMPRTLVHGDFVQANVRVRTGPDGVAFLPFDWEIAGWGAPATDLAQFMDGSISPENPVSPDLTAYWSATRECWPHLGLHDIRRLADLGTISWLLANTSWESRGLECGWAERSMKHLRTYRAGMAESIRIMGWKP